MSEFRQDRRHWTLTPTGLTVSPGCPFEQWEALGDYLGGLAKSVNWALGDWLVFGEGSYPDRYSQALDATDCHYATLVNCAWVARHVGRAVRRDDLTWSHHAEVAALEPADQEAWLARAAAEGWSVRRFKEELEPFRRERMLHSRDPHIGETSPHVRRVREGGAGNDPLEGVQRAYLQLSAGERREFRRWLASRREAVEG